MPTTTTTVTANNPLVLPTMIQLKGSQSHSSPQSDVTSTTLRSLYTRAARAFLHREIPLTHSLIASAFDILHQPVSSAPDGLAPHRKKWDILRITLETTIYASPPVAADLEALPAPLRENYVLSPAALITMLHSRSLNFFTPTTRPTTSSVVLLPSQVLLTLVLSSLKIGCPEVGRVMIEDWLARRGRREEPPHLDDDAYDKILETYCLHVMPLLGKWDDAREYLRVETELASDSRERFMSSLQSLHSQALAARRPASPTRHSVASPSQRPPSPASSISSTSSSLSTASNHTAVPRTPRPNSLVGIGSLKKAASASTTSLSSVTTVTAQTFSKSRQHGTSNGHASTSHHGQNGVTEPTGLPLPRAPRSVLADGRQSNPSVYSLVRTSLEPYLTTPRLTTMFIIFVVLPVLSFLVRARRRRLRAAATFGAGPSNTADLVRRRLKATEGLLGGRANLLAALWAEVVRVIGDTIRMGGSGLV